MQEELASPLILNTQWALDFWLQDKMGVSAHLFYSAGTLLVSLTLVFKLYNHTGRVLVYLCTLSWEKPSLDTNKLVHIHPKYIYFPKK